MSKKKKSKNKPNQYEKRKKSNKKINQNKKKRNDTGLQRDSVETSIESEQEQNSHSVANTKLDISNSTSSSNDKKDATTETICKEIDVPVTNVVTEMKECTQNLKLKSPESEPWWKTARIKKSDGSIEINGSVCKNAKLKLPEANDTQGQGSSVGDYSNLNAEQSLNNTTNTEQNSSANSVEDNLIGTQGQGSFVGDYAEQGLNNDASNTKQNSRTTSAEDNLNVTKDQGSFVGDASDSIINKISILVAVIVIIFGFAFYYEPIFEIFFPPVDLPIFGNLINTTNSLSRQLVELDIPASSVIIEYRVTSKFLADVINRHELSSKNSDSVAQYLNQLGDKIIKSGEAIEKMYLTGNYVLKELMAELKSINDEIYQEKVITKRDAIYFVERHEKILTTITKLRDELRMTVNELDDLYNLYNGMHHQLANGMKDVEFFFSGIKLELMERYRYDTGKLEQNFGYLLQIMKKVPDIRHRINNLLSEFDKHRLAVIECRSEWVGLWRRKLVTYDDTKRFEEVIQKLTNVIRIFKKKDLENIEKRIYI
ncbi:24150_t:CDS:2 [Cetraspora pellucida]|uniref:24150_t:CDS:1 n=1 Tax=Cetraspora pellucida TaxID=1433469 RepID=A0A9N9HQF6_9GLOM|nr:24150_t:CDS:2 [Cetraspora pellucida]